MRSSCRRYRQHLRTHSARGALIVEHYRKEPFDHLLHQPTVRITFILADHGYPSSEIVVLAAAAAQPSDRRYWAGVVLLAALCLDVQTCIVYHCIVNVHVSLYRVSLYHVRACITVSCITVS